jgi:polyphosphate:AMP phosphotransferase
MFESAELGHKVSKTDYEKELPALREALLNTQYELVSKKGFQVVIIVSGVDGGGRSESVHLLNEWLDPRHVETHGMGMPSDEERDRPVMWRFWRALPAKGKIGIFQGSWYSLPILSRVYGQTKLADIDDAMERNILFEKMLADEGALILKFWFHLSKPKQESRLKLLEKDPLTRWRVTERDWHHFSLYDKFQKTTSHVLRLTSTAQAQWYIIEGTDERYRSLMLGKILLESLRRHLDTGHAPAHSIGGLPSLPKIDDRQVLRALDMTQSIEKKEYEKKLEALQGRLALLTRDPRFQEISVVAVFEGNDAAGKGGAIRRVTSALDARIYNVIPIAAPSEEERAQPYMWRFWRRLPRRGRLAVFDRSWYGRVLVERVEGLLLGIRLDARLQRDQRIRGAARRGTTWSSSNSGCRSPRRSNWRASRRASRRPSSSSRSRTRTGATANNGRPTNRPSATWSTAPALKSPPGRWSRPMTSATRASGYSRLSATASNRR